MTRAEVEIDQMVAATPVVLKKAEAAETRPKKRLPPVPVFVAEVLSRSSENTKPCGQVFAKAEPALKKQAKQGPRLFGPRESLMDLAARAERNVKVLNKGSLSLSRRQRAHGWWPLVL